MNPNDELPPNLSPFEKDVIDGPVRPSPSFSPPSPAPLSEDNFIQNQNPIAPFPFWVWLFLATVAAALIWGSWGWYEQNIKKFEKNEPFLQVTNRDFSVFLWKFPNYLRANVEKKTGYLSEFRPDRAIFTLSAADNYVTAPPDLLFLYHTWNRLLAPEFIARPIATAEFSEFLDQVSEWKPEYWVQAPEAYKNLINDNAYKQFSNLQILPEKTLPLIVRQAFQGWKNYFKEGEQINALQVTYAQVQDFLKNHPGYDRPNWRNIAQVVDQPVAGNNYLSFLQKGVLDTSQPIPEDQLSLFLKVTLFNEQQAKQEK